MAALTLYGCCRLSSEALSRGLGVLGPGAEEANPKTEKPVSAEEQKPMDQLGFGDRKALSWPPPSFSPVLEGSPEVGPDRKGEA